MGPVQMLEQHGMTEWLNGHVMLLADADESSCNNSSKVFRITAVALIVTFNDNQSQQM